MNDGQGRIYHDTLDGVPSPAASTRLIGHAGPVDEACAIIGAGHHAILFEGDEGIGKATAAFHLANALVSGAMPSSAPLPRPDPSSAVYRQIAQGGHPNLMHLTRPHNATGSGFRTVITIDEVRRVSHFLSMTPGEDAPRVVIIDPVGDMPRAAANALLKTLEEPPANTLFILIAHGTGRLLATIKSRCQRLRFSPLSDEEVTRVLNQVAPQASQAVDPDALAALAAGSPRRALMMALYGGVDLWNNLDALMTAPRRSSRSLWLASVSPMSSSSESVSALACRGRLIVSQRIESRSAIRRESSDMGGMRADGGQ